MAMGNFTIILSIRVPTGLIAAKVPPIELELPGPVAKQVTPAFAAIFIQGSNGLSPSIACTCGVTGSFSSL